MATIPQPSLFSWQQVDTASDLDRLRLVLSALPDEPLVRFLEERRGRGRDDYPVRAMWNALIAGLVFQHPSAAALIRELWRNSELRQLCGFDPLRGLGATPSDDAFGRFLELIIEHRDKLVEMFQQLVEELSRELPELGRRLAVDSKGIRSAGKPVKDEQKQKEPDGRRDLDADWGTKTYKGARADELREMAFVGFEKDRGCLKYRCPAAVYGFECQGRAECEKLAPLGVGEFGRTVRVPLATDRRTAVERVNSRLDRVLGFEEHFIRCKAKMEARVSLALVVMLAMALGRVRANQAELIRSLTAPVRRAS